MKRSILAALTAAALLIPALAAAAPAVHALPFGPGDDAPPIPDSQSCSVTNVDVSATADGNRNTYKYDLICQQGTPTIHVVGGYSFDTKAANEALTTNKNEISANWTCPHDPWIAPSAPVCSRVSVVDTSKVVTGTARGIALIDLIERILPFSVEYLDDNSRQTLFVAQLSYARTHAPGTVQVIDDPNIKDHECIVCTVLSTPPAPAPAPTQPDFKVPTLGGDTNLANGMTSVYSIGVSNLGTRPPTQVQVAIQVSGSLEYVAMAQTPDGWDCSGTGPITCVGPLGGAGDPVQSLAVNFQVQVRGAKAGIGAISASADPNGLIDEGDETNNARTLAITVK